MGPHIYIYIYVYIYIYMCIYIYISLHLLIPTCVHTSHKQKCAVCFLVSSSRPSPKRLAAQPARSPCWPAASRVPIRWTPEIGAFLKIVSWIRRLPSKQTPNGKFQNDANLANRCPFHFGFPSKPSKEGLSKNTPNCPVACRVSSEKAKCLNPLALSPPVACLWNENQRAKPKLAI